MAMALGILMSPGFGFLALYRAAVRLRGLPIFGRVTSKIMWRMSVLTSGCHVSLEASIGGGLSLPHPTGIVVGEGCMIGSGVTLFQNVTLGRSGQEAKYPVLGNGVTIYAGSVVIGDVRIGDGAVVGANSVVLIHVPAGAVAVGSPARIVRRPSDRA